MDFGKYIAHKGLLDMDNGIPENSLPAFELACKKGISIELDVRMTKDGKIVTFHDKSLKRMCGVDADISDFTYEQLSAFGLQNTNEKIPLLSQVLKLVEGRVPILVEIKDSFGLFDIEKRTYHLLKKYKGEYAVQSFNPISLLWFRIFAPKVERGQLISKFRGKKTGEYLLRLLCANPTVWKLISKPDFIACDLRSVSLETVFSAMDCNADFITWTADSPELIKTAEQFSKSVICENFPENFDFSDNYVESQND
ncbi:MAG: glycerophosphodiester phosphodiesterase family protein [Oscillospiraceae bacterium]